MWKCSDCFPKRFDQWVSECEQWLYLDKISMLPHEFFFLIKRYSFCAQRYHWVITKNLKKTENSVYSMRYKVCIKNDTCMIINYR